jgi:hypothetical integral membrane protein (TIGR02206 family)
MGKMHAHEFIAPFSLFWWECILSIAFIIFVIVSIPLHWKNIKRRNYDLFIAFILLMNNITEHWYNYSIGYWNLQQNLPVHLCSVTNILCIVLLINYKQWIAELVYYWGLAGGIQSLLTPEFTIGMGGYNFYSYFINHGGLILVVAYMIVHFEFVPRPKSWLWALGYTQILAIGVGIVNYFVQANYMYLSKKPEVNNPFIIGEWPYYIFILEAVALLHFFVFYLPFHGSNKRKKALASTSNS